MRRRRCDIDDLLLLPGHRFFVCFLGILAKRLTLNSGLGWLRTWIDRLSPNPPATIGIVDFCNSFDVALAPCLAASSQPHLIIAA